MNRDSGRSPDIFATTSAGAHIDNPRWARQGVTKLADAQQVLGRKKRGSANRRAARDTVAARHRKVANQRRDFHHKITRALVAGHDVIVVEKLKVANMVRRAQPQAVFRCRSCEHQAHADEHAARNILGAGLALPAADQAA